MHVFFDTEETKNTMENTAEKLTKLFEKHNREFRFDPQVSHRWIVNAFDEYTKTASGSVAAPKEETLKQVQIDYYENKLEGMFRNQADQEKELASLRQQLKEREEALKELLPIVEWYATEYPMDAENLKAKATIEKARKLI